MKSKPIQLSAIKITNLSLSLVEYYYLVSHFTLHFTNWISYYAWIMPHDGYLVNLTHPSRHQCLYYIIFQCKAEINFDLLPIHPSHHITSSGIYLKILNGKQFFPLHINILVHCQHANFICQCKRQLYTWLDFVLDSIVAWCRSLHGGECSVYFSCLSQFQPQIGFPCLNECNIQVGVVSSVTIL